jgi:cytochrome bd-type quinol oxidase subunit 2
MRFLALTSTHLVAMMSFAIVVSVTFGLLSRRGPVERAKYIVWAFAAFLLVAIGIGWLMYPFSQ